MLEHLPLLIINHILSYIDCPLDLLSLGQTCRQLRQMTLNHKLWERFIFDFFDGIWILAPRFEFEEDKSSPKDLVLHILRHIAWCNSYKPRFFEGEEWTRVRDFRLECLVGMLGVLYDVDKTYKYPHRLDDRWIYDIGLYRRGNPTVDFTQPLSREVILQLDRLSQASQHDLRRHKQPHLNPKYYIRLDRIYPTLGHAFSSPDGQDLFPFLLDPSCVGSDSKLTRYLICLSKRLAERLKPEVKSGRYSLQEMIRIVQGVASASTPQERREHCQKYGLDYDSSFGNASPFHDTHACEVVRKSIRKMLKSHLESLVSGGPFVKLFLTDSRALGGDNQRQEMLCGCFISHDHVLVIWHLLGLMRY